MNGITDKIKLFLDDLRSAGIPVGISQVEDCFQALLRIDWPVEPVFHAALLATLLKESAYIPIFNELYARHFFPWDIKGGKNAGQERLEATALHYLAALGSGKAGPDNREGESQGAAPIGPRSPGAKTGARPKNPLTLDFYEATYSGGPDDTAAMEKLVPLLAKRMASKMVMKKRRNQHGALDFRKTMRLSLNHGGIPLDVFVRRKIKEKPVIFALCDVSWSCLHYSYFSLAMVYSLEKFFRQVRSFAFIGVTDEITSIVKREPYHLLRAKVMNEANVSGDTGYTDYGSALASFYEQYGKELSHKSQVLIFGDARTNWFPSRPETLREIQRRVKGVYWFNPDPEAEWGTGDSSMPAYRKYCRHAFACANLEQLADAICRIQ